MNKNNKVYVSKISKKITNNSSFFSTLDKRETEKNEKKENDSKNIIQKINDIFNSRNYIYKADVIIKTNDGILRKRVIGRNSTYLITSENELIPINEIKDIEYQ